MTPARRLSRGAPLHAEVSRLLALPLPDLRAEWHRCHPDRQMPARLPRDLLVRMIVWKLQVEACAPPIAALAKRLSALARQLERSGTLDIEREAHLRPGTSLVREWRGKTYRVTALEEGFAYAGSTFPSLSHVAREITGTRWSGPRFFGLDRRAGRARTVTEQAS